jgi:DNA-binding SARP family transcriptional activator
MKAGALYELGIERDAVCEEFYQHLMVCWKNLGQEARAAHVYKQCRLMLSQELGLQPSSRTEEIRRTLAPRR